MASILLVDDDLDGSSALLRFLIKAGHRAIAVPNGREALAMLASGRPDLILLDIRMPEMDGVMFLQVLRSYLRWQDIPVIVVTALPEGLELDRVRKYNVKAVFRKSEYKFEELMAVADQALAK